MTDTTHRTRVGLFTCIKVERSVSPPDWVLEADNVRVKVTRDMESMSGAKYSYYALTGSRERSIRPGNWLVFDPLQVAVHIVDADCFEAFFEVV